MELSKSLYSRYERPAFFAICIWRAVRFVCPVEKDDLESAEKDVDAREECSEFESFCALSLNKFLRLKKSEYISSNEPCLFCVNFKNSGLQSVAAMSDDGYFS